MSVPAFYLEKEFITPLKELGKDKEFRYYGFNPHAKVDILIVNSNNENATNNIEEQKKRELKNKQNFLIKWPIIRADNLYSGQNPQGVGWFQEHRLCVDNALRNKKVNKNEEEKIVVPMDDLVNGGTAYRIYSSKTPGGYYVIDSNNKIITNLDSIDPTMLYGSGDSHGNCNCGNCFGGYSNMPDTEKGPVRI